MRRSALWVSLVLVLGCPELHIVSVEIDDVGRDHATLVVKVGVTNPKLDEPYVASTSLALAVDPEWSIREVRYGVPGEPMTRRAKPSPPMAAKADWTFQRQDLSWWGYISADHVVPPGESVYRIEVDVQVPPRTRAGSLAVVVGEPGPDAKSAAFDLTLRPGKAVKALGPLLLNPDSQLQSASDAAGGVEAAFADLGQGVAAAGEGLQNPGGNEGELREIGTLLGVNTGARGFREPWIQQATEDGAIRLSNVSLTLPDDWSILGDPPTGPEIALVVMPPGSPCMMGLELVPDLNEAMAAEAFQREVTTAHDDLDGTSTAPVRAEDLTLTSPGGLDVGGRGLHYTDEYGPGQLMLLHRYGNGTLVLAVTFGDESTMDLARDYLLQLMDAVRFE